MKTVWNPSGGRTCRADRVDVLVTRPEITLEFCDSGETGGISNAEPAPIVARIVVNPHMVKRLARVLAETVQKNEDVRERFDDEEMVGGKLLHDLVRGLGVPHGYEYSFKMCEELLLANRFLITLNKKMLGEDYRRKVIELCKKLRAPASFLEAMDASIAKARLLHFGFEASEKGGMHKVYLEFPLPTLTEPTLVHTSYKWDPLHAKRHAVGTYVRYPLLSYDDTAERIQGLLAGCQRAGAFEIVDYFLRLAMPRLKESFHYMEVTEEGNPRNSFDVNFYSAFLTMGDIRPLLLRVAERYSLASKEFSARLDSVAKSRFGHLTGGIDREGRDFFTFHFGVERH
jgi:hypothetical protein